MENNVDNCAIFIGHNECYGVSAQQVEQAIIDLINKGVNVFISGGQGGFDRLCAGCVHRLKKQYPHIKNCLVIPYLTFTVFNKDIFDDIIYPEGFEKYHFKAAIPARNRYMVDNADILFAVWDKSSGGTGNTVNYALSLIEKGEKKEIRIKEIIWRIF